MFPRFKSYGEYCANLSKELLGDEEADQTLPSDPGPEDIDKLFESAKKALMTGKGYLQSLENTDTSGPGRRNTLYLRNDELRKICAWF